MVVDYKTIPGYSRYKLSSMGEIVEVGTGRVIAPTCGSSGIPIVRLKSDTYKWMSPSIARLVLLTYKPLESQWTAAYAYVVYADGNKAHVKLDNLDWGFETYRPLLVPGINIKNDVFVAIPGYPNYAINGLGVLQHRARGSWSYGYHAKDGRLRVNIENDKGKLTGSFIHRLLALTFLEHPVDTSELVVNHKDGNCYNNMLSNLEWTTHAGNNTHACATGLRPNCISLVAMNVDTRETRSFYSFGDCARFLKSTPQALYDWVARCDEWRPYKGFWVKPTSSDEPWPDENVTFKPLNYDHVPIAIKDIRTGAVSTFDNGWAADRAFGFPKGTSIIQARRKADLPYRSCWIRPAVPDPVWPDATRLIERGLVDKIKKSGLRPIRVTNTKTTEASYFPSVGSWCEEMAVPSTTVRRHINTGVPYRGHLVEHV